MGLSEHQRIGKRDRPAPSIRDYGDLLQVTATIGGAFSDVPQGSPAGTGCPGGASCFS